MPCESSRSLQLADLAIQSIVARLLLPLLVRMIKELRCADVFAGCAHVEQGHDFRALMRQFLIHVRDTHHVVMPSPALRIQAMTAVREVHAQLE